MFFFSPFLNPDLSKTVTKMLLFRTTLAWTLTGIPSLILAQGEPPVVDLGTSVHQASLNVRHPQTNAIDYSLR